MSEQRPQDSELHVVPATDSAVPPATIGRLIARTALVADSAAYSRTDRKRTDAAAPSGIVGPDDDNPPQARRRRWLWPV